MSDQYPTPYHALGPEHFWRTATDLDYGRKFIFTPDTKFAIAGSCFAQHFGRELRARGGHMLLAEKRPSLVPEDSNHGYDIFSARYGNIYTAQHLRELVYEALGRTEVTYDLANMGGYWFDLLRPKAVPDGFDSEAHAILDRQAHLAAVDTMLRTMDVLIFTLGLTETWERIDGWKSYAYPIVPGAAAGTFDPKRHFYRNARVDEVTADLQAVVNAVLKVNPTARFLFTVSPVGLVATREMRSPVVSTFASKAVLRAAVEELMAGMRSAPIDYFPSYELVMWNGMLQTDGRDVRRDAPAAVMDLFFRTRMPTLVGKVPAAAAPVDPTATAKALVEAECTELLLDPK